MKRASSKKNMKWNERERKKNNNNNVTMKQESPIAIYTRNFQASKTEWTTTHKKKMYKQSKIHQQHQENHNNTTIKMKLLKSTTGRRWAIECVCVCVCFLSILMSLYRHHKMCTFKFALYQIVFYCFASLSVSLHARSFHLFLRVFASSAPGRTFN